MGWWRDGWFDLMNGRMNGFTWMAGEMDGLMLYRLTGGWMHDKWMDGWVDGWMDGWIDLLVDG